MVKRVGSESHSTGSPPALSGQQVTGTFYASVSSCIKNGDDDDDGGGGDTKLRGLLGKGNELPNVKTFELRGM